ncbi:hypothetical protein BV25DRAFT_1788094, partial [Artomyces pyxidatus]
HKLSTTDRPSEMAHWIRRKRDYAKPPPIEDVQEFADNFRRWWGGMQPEWRGRQWPLKRDSIPGETWEATRKGGANGIVIVIIMLSWWAE